MKIKIINGPNLNMLGQRNNTIYGNKTYDDLILLINNYCLENTIEASIISTNYEGKIIEEIHDTYLNNYDGLIINPGALTHYSYSIRDALEIVKCLKVEVHISNIYEREAFRSINVIKDVVNYSIVGEGINGYIKAIKYIQNNKNIDK